MDVEALKKLNKNKKLVKKLGKPWIKLHSFNFFFRVINYVYWITTSHL
jgi:predicted solute-binding protein